MRHPLLAMVAALAAAAFSLTPTASTAGVAQTAGTSVSLTHTGCAFTVTYTWSGFQGSDDSATVFVIENNNTPIAPSFTQQHVHGKGGTLVYAFTPLTPTATLNNFTAYGQLSNGQLVISGSLDFSSPDPATCTV
jgi:hypothetical protein